MLCLVKFLKGRSKTHEILQTSQDMPGQSMSWDTPDMSRCYDPAKTHP